MLPFLLAYSAPLLTGPMPLVAATLGAEGAEGGLGVDGREAAGREAGREGAREGAAEGRAAVVRTGAGSLGALGACWSLVGTAGP